MDMKQPRPSDVLDAELRLHKIVVNTPILQSTRINTLVGGTVSVKLESLQHTGAFKFRGAYNCLSQLDSKRYPDGVLAYSTGNHGQAIATVGNRLGLRTTVVMPSDAPAVKRERAREQGANIILYDRKTESRKDIAKRLASAGTFAVIPPGDHPDVIAGQGTVALESLRALGQESVDLVMAPCGGGGLSAGTCLALDALRSKAEVWAVEPERFDDTRRSLVSGVREVNADSQVSICDALLAKTPALLPFSINQNRLSGVLTADDVHVLRAMRLLYEEFRVVVEPGGAVAMASLLANPAFLKGRHAVVIASGGNVDINIFLQAIG